MMFRNALEIEPNCLPIGSVETVETIGTNDALLLRRCLLILDQEKRVLLDDGLEALLQFGQVLEIAPFAFLMIVEHDVRHVFKGPFLIGLEELAEQGFSFLGAHHVEAEQIDNGRVVVTLLHQLQVPLQCGGGRFGPSGKSNLVRSNLDARLLPEERDGPASLQKGRYVALVSVDQLLRFDKVGHMSVVVGAADVEARAGTFAAEPGEDAGLELAMPGVNGAYLYAAAGDSQEPLRTVDPVVLERQIQKPVINQKCC